MLLPATLCQALQHAAGSTQQHTAARGSTRQHAAARSSTRHHTAAHSSTRQHMAAHGSTLQHPATHYNALQTCNFEHAIGCNKNIRAFYVPVHNLQCVAG